VSALAPTLQAFFTDRLIRQRQVSPHTIAAYRDAFRLLLGYLTEHRGKGPATLDFEDLDAATIGGFLTHLEEVRGVSVATRNARLAAVHSLFAFAALRHPEHAELIARVLAIPAKRGTRALVTFLSRPEIDVLLATPDRTRWTGRRDHTLLTLDIQTGLRVSELTALQNEDVTLARGAHLRVHGKGRKERITPLTSHTVTVLQAWFDERGATPTDPVFPNPAGGPLSRDAVRKLLPRRSEPRPHQGKRTQDSSRPVPHNPGGRILGIAKSVSDGGEFAVRRPAVMNNDAAQWRQHSHRVHRNHTAPLVQVVQGEKPGRHRMDPVQRGLDPQTPLIGVDHISSAQLVSKCGQKGVKSFGSFFDHGHDRPGRHWDPVGVTQQLGDPFDRDVLTDHQVRHQRPQVRAVTRRAGRLERKRGGRLSPTRAPATLNAMLGDRRLHRRQFKHLASLLPSHRCIFEIRSAPLAVFRRVLHHRGQVLTRGARLLTRLLARTTTPGLRRRLGVAIRRRRPRGVPRVHAHPGFQLRDLRGQGHDQRVTLGKHNQQLLHRKSSRQCRQRRWIGHKTPALRGRSQYGQVKPPATQANISKPRREGPEQLRPTSYNRPRAATARRWRN